jgi:hypothetical protein
MFFYQLDERNAMGQSNLAFEKVAQTGWFGQFWLGQHP